MLGQVEDQQRAHAVIGEALPHLGEEQHVEAARMADELGFACWRSWRRREEQQDATDRAIQSPGHRQSTPNMDAAAFSRQPLSARHTSGAKRACEADCCAPAALLAPRRCSTTAPRSSRCLATRRSGRPRDLVAPGPDRRRSFGEILAIAARTPDHGKLHPWRFVHVARDRRAAFAALLDAAYRADNPEPGPARDRGRSSASPPRRPS